jgi:hypothetical protein
MCTVGVQLRSDAVHWCARRQNGVHWRALVCSHREYCHFVHHTKSGKAGRYDWPRGQTDWRFPVLSLAWVISVASLTESARGVARFGAEW